MSLNFRSRDEMKQLSPLPLQSEIKDENGCIVSAFILNGSLLNHLISIHYQLEHLSLINLGRQNVPARWPVPLLLVGLVAAVTGAVCVSHGRVCLAVPPGKQPKLMEAEGFSFNRYW